VRLRLRMVISRESLPCRMGAIPTQTALCSLVLHRAAAT
jgi:hypothetical protein